MADNNAHAVGYFQVGTVIEKGLKGFEPVNPGLGWVCVEIGNKTPEGYWMRLVQPYASNKFGFAFYPEIGDQVLTVRIGEGEFICLGSLYTKKTPAKIKNDEGDKYGKNFIKEIRTKAGNAITINDEEGKEFVQIDVKEGAISLKMDIGGKMISLDGGADTKDVKVKSSDALLTVEVKDAIVKATGAVVEFKSDKISVKGAQITVKSDGKINIEGGGKIVIKGSAVDIC